MTTTARSIRRRNVANVDDSGDDREPAVFAYWDDAHDGPGWYFYGYDYPDEGSFGAYATLALAEAGAIENGYLLGGI